MAFAGSLLPADFPENCFVPAEKSGDPLSEQAL